MSDKLNKKTFSMLLISLLIGITACSPGNIRRDSNLQDTLLHYETMMNRSDFTAAAQFRLPTARWDTQGLQRYQLSHYEVKQSDGKDDGDRLEQTVFLRYFDRNSMRERSTFYKEVWIYNTKSKQWQLDGEPPVFK